MQNFGLENHRMLSARQPYLFVENVCPSLRCHIRFISYPLKTTINMLARQILIHFRLVLEFTLISKIRQGEDR